MQVNKLSLINYKNKSKTTVIVKKDALKVNVCLKVYL